MTYSPHPKGTVLLKAKRDTIVLLAAATALTFAVSYAAHKRPNAIQAASAPEQHQVWAGQLSELASDKASAKPTEQMTSASLVVAPSAVALPTVEAPRPIAAVKPRPCDGTGCPLKVSIAAAPAPVRPAVALAPSASPIATTVERKEKPSLMAKLNPMNHIPDAMRHPLDYAGDTFSGWMKRL